MPHPDTNLSLVISTFLSIMVLAIVLFLCVLASIEQRTNALPNEVLLSHLRKFNRPMELNIDSAKALHADIKARARAIEALHGHKHSSLPPVRLSSVAAYSNVGNGNSNHLYGSLRSPLPPTLTPSNSSVLPSPPIIYPTDFGADPSGRNDSSAALALAVAALLKGGAPHHMAEGITDLGGATLDLAGGQYLLSSPIVIPPYYGNLLIARGTLRASSHFPANKWLVMIGDHSCSPPSGQGSCNEFVNLADILFDAAHIASGGVYVSHVMGTTIGPAFFVGYNQVC